MYLFLLTQVLSETTDGETIHYVHGLDLVAEALETGTFGGPPPLTSYQIDCFLYDGLGSVRQLVDNTTSATLLLAQTFDPYGNLYASAGTGASAYGYTGEMQDANGLLYLRARYYSPQMGRFLNTDPSRQEINPYQYAYSNPFNHTDPSGLIPERADVEGGKAEYTCNCGWIDWSHTPVGKTGLRILHALEEASQRTSCGTYWVIETLYFQDADLNDYFSSIPVDVDPFTIADFSSVWFLPIGSSALANTDVRKGIALNMFKLYSESIENAQTINPISMAAPTNFSEEDLFSNLLGFWAELEGKSGNEARQAIRDICSSFVFQDGDQAGIDASLWVYDSVYGGQPWVLQVKSGQVSLPPLTKQTLWETGWRKWEPRLVPLPNINFSANYFTRVNQCAINNNARCMPSEIQQLLTLEQHSPHVNWPWGQLNRSNGVQSNSQIWQENNVNLYETSW